MCSSGSHKRMQHSFILAFSCDLSDGNLAIIVYTCNTKIFHTENQSLRLVAPPGMMAPASFKQCLRHLLSFTHSGGKMCGASQPTERASP